MRGGVGPSGRGEPRGGRGGERDAAGRRGGGVRAGGRSCLWPLGFGGGGARKGWGAPVRGNGGSGVGGETRRPPGRGKAAGGASAGCGGGGAAGGGLSAPGGGGVPARLSAGPRPLGCSSRARRGGEGRAPRAALPPGGGGDGGPGLQQPFPGVSSPTPRPPRLQPAEGVRHPCAGAAIPSRANRSSLG